MSRPKIGAIRTLRVNRSDDLRTIYQKVRQSFTAADLQRYTETEEMLSTEKLLADLEAVHKKVSRKRRQKKA
jgi:hypothetical protein